MDNISRALTTGFMAATLFSGPAEAQGPVITVPSQLGANLERLSPATISACFAHYDARYRAIIEAEGDPEIAASYLKNVQGKQGQDVTCGRYVKHTPNGWKNEGCWARRAASAPVGTASIAMDLQMRVDLSVGDLFRTVDDDSDPAFLVASYDNNMEIWGADNNSDPQRSGGIRGYSSQNVTIGLPSADDIAMLKLRMQNLSDTCRPTI